MESSADITPRGLLPLLRELEGADALTPTALVLSDPEMPMERFEALGAFIGRLRDATAFWLGDWMIFGEGVYGHESYQLAEAAGRSPSTMQNYRWVASRVVRSRRRETLSWSHHEAVAALEPRPQRRWLDKAERERLSVVELRALVKAAREPEASGAASGSPQVVANGEVRAHVERVVCGYLETLDPDEPPSTVEIASRIVGEVFVLGSPCPTCGRRVE